MTDLDYCKVVGRFGVVIGPGKDETPCSSGLVRFTPLQNYSRVSGAIPDPMGMIYPSVKAEIDSSGYLFYKDNRYVDLIDFGSTKVKPRAIDDVATYKVEFEELYAGEYSVDIETFYIRPDPLVENNLISMIPLEIIEGVSIIGEGSKGDKGDKGEDGSNVLPTDTAIANAVNMDGSDTRIALDSIYVNESDLDIDSDIANAVNMDSSDTRIALDSIYVNESDLDTDVGNLFTLGGDTETALLNRIVAEMYIFSPVYYRGTWNGSTNIPELVDGVGTQGDFYQVSTSGTRSLGSGSITWAVGDFVEYDAGVWIHISNGTV